MSDSPDIGSGGEFGWIRQLADRFGTGWLPDGTLGIGDDAAAYGTGPQGFRWVVSVDAQVSGVHYRPGWFDWPDIGRRLVHVGFSDVAAIGAAPYACLVSVEIGPQVGRRERDSFTEGLASGTHEVGARLIGGNIAARTTGFSAHITVIGRSESDPLLRSGARPGEAICVTGYLGDAGAGRAILASDPGEAMRRASLVGAFRRPRAHWREGLALSRSGAVTAAIDLSDGLAADLGHLCDASGVGALVASDALPLSPELRDWCKAGGRNATESALYGAEDYLILFTAPERALPGLTAALQQIGGHLWRIGATTESHQIEILRAGRREGLPRRGFDHLAGR